MENLKWRYATKKYDTTRKVSETQINSIKEAIRLSASSYGLQLFKVLDIRSRELRERLQPATWGQSQVTEASHFFVFCNYLNVNDGHVDEYMDLKASTQELELNAIKGYGDFVKTKLSLKSPEEKQWWTAKQTYIALANAMNACAELNIDSTPMEGFDPEDYNRILDLESQGLSASVLLAIGYRSEKDTAQHGKKVRKSIPSIFETI